MELRWRRGNWSSCQKLSGGRVFPSASSRALSTCFGVNYRDPPNWSIDLIATDVVMPEMNGSQLVETVLEARPDIRVLFMSGYTDDEVMRRGVIDGQTAFLQKPFTPDLLAQKVREVLDVPAREHGSA
ncbi:MAG TPA: response regulator [Gemmatimonadaceae bacterium]